MSELKEGQKAPAISAKDQDGNTVSLDQFIGKTVVLFFYPKDNTPGCTAEACDFRDNYQGLTAKGIVVLGVSVDDEKSHQRFITKHSLPFTLLADTDKKIVTDYGVWGEKNLYGKKYMGTNRTTFIIDENGLIAHIIRKVDTKNSTAQVLELLP
ncbi:thioredoxin-dependent thiol peroxidase [Pedobacter hiemivivus]|uniref:thioredoxin-dependent peroxiredoxin n=1 Tax=Pedobacter hiemivivus TaxID=2530454 RepID=A0A4U1GEZ8_9SPHI|nr:thioredoxin-dependent thiol peroxidase [Pedobacter hiemivivus]TCC95843.1 thioredoxin-dependent thiol peroxidase [Pedobacter hiemivivus]TKC61363.1 thioredoxin-dependent thiol peroxidase [Pedobacter hiemivivus]